MKKNECVILDIRSTYMTVCRGVQTFRGEIMVTARSEGGYAGYYNGKFLEPDNLSLAIGQLISNVQENSGKVHSIVVGVPSEFCVNIIDSVEMVYPKPIKIKPKNLYTLMEKAHQKKFSDKHDIISINEISYNLDSRSNISDPIGMTSNRINLLASFVLAENSFIELISKALYSLGISDIRFIPSALCEGIELISEDDRRDGCILVDFDDMSVSVSAILRSGLVALKTFMSGEYFVTNDISEVLRVPFSTASELKHKAVLSLEARPNDTYMAFIDGQAKVFPCGTVNNIISSRLDNIAEIVLGCIEKSDVEYSKDTKVFVTGNGICSIIGFDKVFERVFDKKINVVCPKSTYFAKPYFSSCISILDYALKNL